MLEKNAPKREYKLADGALVPGVTTVLAELAKPALLQWAWSCGKDNVPLSQVRDATAGVGTIAHYLIMCWLTGDTPKISPAYDPVHIEKAQVPFESFLKYYSQRRARWLFSEKSVINEVARYGGTIDLAVNTPEGIEIWDIKTSKAIYDEYYLQLAAYRSLLARESPKYKKAKGRIILVTQEGNTQAPDISRTKLYYASNVWWKLLKTYHALKVFRSANTTINNI